jgi:hypothetical protein
MPLVKIKIGAGNLASDAGTGAPAARGSAVTPIAFGAGMPRSSLEHQITTGRPRSPEYFVV